MSGCKTATPFGSYPNHSELDLKKTKPKREKATILYASDSPSEFVRFSTFFTEKLNNEKIYNVVHDHELNSTWLKNKKIKKETFELEIKNMIHLLKSNYKNKEIEKLISNNIKFQNEFINLLSLNPLEVKENTLTEFFFWSAVAEVQNNLKSKNSLIAYQYYSSLSEKNLFSLEVDAKTLDILHMPVYSKSKKIIIYNKNKCLVFVNGYRVKSDEINLPLNLQSTISASCSEGNYSQIFFPINTDSIFIHKIKPINEIIAMPASENLAKEKLQITGITKLILIFWSKKNSLLEVKVIEAKSMIELKQASFKLSSHKNFNEVEKKIILFLQKSEK